MKKVNFLISIGIVALAVFNINWYLNKKQNNPAMVLLDLENENELSESATDSEVDSATESGAGSGSETENVANGEQVTTDEMREKFSVKIADGWEERVAPEGIVAIVVNGSEEIEETAAKEIGFNSYYAINHDVLRGENLESHIKYEKAGLLQVAPNIEFIEEEKTEINGSDAYFMEAEFNDGSLDYKVFIVIVMDDDDIWSVSFNTTRQYGEEYRELAREIFESFTIK